MLYALSFPPPHPPFVLLFPSLKQPFTPSVSHPSLSPLLHHSTASTHFLFSSFHSSNWSFSVKFPSSYLHFLLSYHITFPFFTSLLAQMNPFLSFLYCLLPFSTYLILPFSFHPFLNLFPYLFLFSADFLPHLFSFLLPEWMKSAINICEILLLLLLLLFHEKYFWILSWKMKYNKVIMRIKA